MLLCTAPVLLAQHVGLPFKLQVDASYVEGFVLLQENEEEIDCIDRLYSKLLFKEIILSMKKCWHWCELYNIYVCSGALPLIVYLKSLLPVPGLRRWTQYLHGRRVWLKCLTCPALSSLGSIFLCRRWPPAKPHVLEASDTEATFGFLSSPRSSLVSHLPLATLANICKSLSTISSKAKHAKIGLEC